MDTVLIADGHRCNSRNTCYLKPEISSLVRNALNTHASVKASLNWPEATEFGKATWCQLLSSFLWQLESIALTITRINDLITACSSMSLKGAQIYSFIDSFWSSAFNGGISFQFDLLKGKIVTGSRAVMLRPHLNGKKVCRGVYSASPFQQSNTEK